MSKKVFICSTLPHAVNIDGVILKGGAGVYVISDYNGALGAPEGVFSEITEEELAILKKSDFYKDWVKNGFLKEIKKISDSVPKDMNKKSGGEMPVLEEKLV